jgi:hypothetical protein
MVLHVLPSHESPDAQGTVSLHGWPTAPVVVIVVHVPHVALPVVGNEQEPPLHCRSLLHATPSASVPRGSVQSESSAADTCAHDAPAGA